MNLKHTDLSKQPFMNELYKQCDLNMFKLACEKCQLTFDVELKDSDDKVLDTLACPECKTKLVNKGRIGEAPHLKGTDGEGKEGQEAQDK